MILAAWKRWMDTGQAWWILVLCAILVLDVLVGSYIIGWELRLLKGMLE